MGSTYTVAELLAMRGNAPSRPEEINPRDVKESNLLGTYLSRFNKYTRLIRDGPEPFRLKYKPQYIEVLRYDFAISNKEFKRRWVKTHNTSAGLKDQRRILVRVFSPRVRFLEEYFRAVSRIEKSLSRLLNRMQVRPSQAVVEPTPSKYGFSTIGNSAPRTKDPRRAVHLHNDLSRGESYFRVIGGLTYTYHPDRPPPAKHWAKYWYFYRKRGFWRPSEHHPYGDEVSRIDHYYEN